MRPQRTDRYPARPAGGHRRWLASFAAIGAAALGLGLAPGAASAAGAAPRATQGRPITPATGLPAGVTPKTSGPAHAAAPAGAHLTYYGGKVISNVSVVQVLYGSGTYTSEVQNTAAPSIASFYGGVTASSYFDWLSEYNTVGLNGQDGQPGSNQTIGRGTFAGQVQITPAAGRNGATISDASIQAELKAQIQAGVLATPSANTLYAVYFPKNKTITQGGGSSGVTFCAYHGTVAAGTTPEFYYSVLPDFTTGGMTSGCGTGTRFDNESSVSSHELVEAVTDAEVGIGTTVSRPLAWYDSTNGEIGDICNGQQASVVGGDGLTYTVQKEFSNQQNNCVVSGPATTNDFSIAVSPTSLSVAAGAGGTATVSTAVTAGAAASVSLSASGLPSGASASFSPTSVNAGGSSTLTLSTTSATAAGSYPITITGVEGSKTHATTLTLTVTGGGGGGGLVNGDFETGSLGGWTSTGSTSVVSGGAQAGTYSARVGSTSPTGDSSISQTFTLPASATGISFWYNVTCPDTVTYDWATATLKDNTTGVTTTPLAKTCVNPSSGWKTVNAPATGGHSVTLTLKSHDDNYAGDPTYTQYDSVTVTTGSGGGGGGIVNGGFETGVLSPWVGTGAATSITTTNHTGSYADMDGKTVATNGDSTTSQTFTAPSGATTLSLWYANSCPDTVTYDWVTVTLKDNTAGTTATLVAKTCAATYTWKQATGSVIAGHSYTLNLVSHDDNYAADPTFTLFDDVTVS